MISIWIANLADLAFGDPYGFPHPVRLIGLYISAFGKIARRIKACRGFPDYIYGISKLYDCLGIAKGSLLYRRELEAFCKCFHIVYMPGRKMPGKRSLKDSSQPQKQ